MCVGFCLSGSVKEHVFFLILGPAATGKSTFGETLMALMGDYGQGVDPGTLAAVKYEGGKARPDLARLHGARVALANESRAGFRIDEGFIKSVTGDDTITARHLYSAEFDFLPTHKIWLRTNFEPQLDGSDSGIRRRMKVVPFDNVVAKKDPALRDTLRNELSGILNWALEGWKDYQHNGWTDPEEVKTATLEYLDDHDTLGAFIAECCEVDSQPSVGATVLHNAYKTWIQLRGQEPLGMPRFSGDLKGRGFTKKRTERGIVWHGIGLRKSTGM
jgi:putative DNA primase/helicase